MDYLFHESKNEKEKVKRDGLIEDLKKAKYMWSKQFSFYTPLEKLLAVLIAGQLLENMKQIMNIEFLSIETIFPFFYNEKKMTTENKYEKIFFFDVKNEYIYSQGDFEQYNTRVISPTVIPIKQNLIDLEKSINELGKT